MYLFFTSFCLSKARPRRILLVCLNNMLSNIEFLECNIIVSFTGNISRIISVDSCFATGDFSMGKMRIMNVQDVLPFGWVDY
jgi:hypothetical protein